MRRREFVAGVSAAAAWPLAARAQQPGKPTSARVERESRIGFLRVGPPPPSWIGGFRDGLREQGLIEGQNVVIDFALTQTVAQITEAAADLVRQKVDIIIAAGTPSVFPARDAGGKIPVVFVGTFDPVETGLVASLSRPGGTITGMTSISGDLTAKRLDFAKELVPNLTKIAILVRESSPTARQYVQQSRSAAQILGLEVQLLSEHDPNELEELISSAKGAGVLVLGDDAEFTTHRAPIAEFALKNHLPSIHGFREMVDAGGLISYGASFKDLYLRAASQVRAILDGASPADVPVGQPEKFELVINLRTASALGLTIPPSLLARADEVIE